MTVETLDVAPRVDDTELSLSFLAHLSTSNR